MSEQKQNKASFLPQQVIIDAYGNHGFVFADMSHKGSLLSLPNKMLAWSVKKSSDISLETLAPVLEIADEIDVFLVGLGEELAFFDKEIRANFREHNVIVEAVSTSAAISTYNVLLAEKRAVAAAFIAVERNKK